MPPSPPFVDPGTGSLDTDQLLAEAIPLAKLITLVGAVALVPLAVAILLGPYSSFTVVFTIAGQFLLAVGAGLVLLYVVSRAIQLAEA